MLSVIIPVYNKLDNLRAVLTCLTKQSDKNFEVVIAVDGSSIDIVDGIKDIVESAFFKVKYVSRRGKHIIYRSRYNFS